MSGGQQWLLVDFWRAINDGNGCCQRWSWPFKGSEGDGLDYDGGGGDGGGFNRS